MATFEILNLSDFDPEKDLVIAYIDIGRMAPNRVRSYLDSVKKQIDPIFEKRGFEVLYVPRREQTHPCVSVSKRKDTEKINMCEFDEAMKVVE